MPLLSQYASHSLSTKAFHTASLIFQQDLFVQRGSAAPSGNRSVATAVLLSQVLQACSPGCKSFLHSGQMARLRSVQASDRRRLRKWFASENSGIPLACSKNVFLYIACCVSVGYAAIISADVAGSSPRSTCGR